MTQLQNFRAPILFKKEEKEIGCHNGIYISFFLLIYNQFRYWLRELGLILSKNMAEMLLLTTWLMETS